MRVAIIWAALAFVALPALCACAPSSDALCDRRTLTTPSHPALFRAAIEIVLQDRAAVRVPTTARKTTRPSLPSAVLARKIESLFAQGLVSEVREIAHTGIFLWESRSAALASSLRERMPGILAGTFATGPSRDASLYPAVMPRVPNDAYWSDQHNLATIGATTAWDVNTDGSRVVVAIVDSGVDSRHIDLARNMWHPPPGFSVQLGGQTLTCSTSDVGYDAVDHTCSPRLFGSHGTNLAGIIGADGNNGVGIAGVNWSASMMVVQMFREVDGVVVGCSSDAIAALDFVLQAKKSGVAVRVVNASWGSETDSPELLAEFDRLMNDGVLIVAAAGNCKSDLDTVPFYPASWTSPQRNLIAVAASNYGADEGLITDSSHGAKSVDVAAPGALTITTCAKGSTYCYNGYQSRLGTSMAAAVVSGAAALVMSTCQQRLRDGTIVTLDAAATKQLLLDSSDRVPGLVGKVQSGRRINLGAAIQKCAAASGITPH